MYEESGRGCSEEDALLLLEFDWFSKWFAERRGLVFCILGEAEMSDKLGQASPLKEVESLEVEIFS